MRISVVSTRRASQSVRDFMSRTAQRLRPPAVVVKRREVPYWQERGWQRRENNYTGAYQGPRVAFYGEIRQHSARDIEFFLYQPSEQIRRHSHWTCFQDRGQGWFSVHMGTRPKDVASGIITIERLIAEAYG